MSGPTRPRQVPGTQPSPGTPWATGAGATQAAWPGCQGSQAPGSNLMTQETDQKCRGPSRLPLTADSASAGGEALNLSAVRKWLSSGSFGSQREVLLHVDSPGPKAASSVETT